MLLIEYDLGYADSHRAVCCGWFRDLDHFSRFKQVEAAYKRTSNWQHVLKDTSVQEYDYSCC